MADFFTKSLLSNLFTRLKSVIMGWESLNILEEHYTVKCKNTSINQKEHVEEHSPIET